VPFTPENKEWKIAPIRPRTRVVGYVRVSTEEQASSGVSLAAQSSKVRQYAELHDLDLVEVVEDSGASAKSLDRPGLKRVLGYLDSGAVQGVVIAKLDRITRSVSDLDKLINWYFSAAAGKELFSVSDSIDTRTAAGRMVLNILMTVAQWERETIVERTSEAMRHKRSKGERLGTIPYGSRLGEDGRTLAPCPVESLNIGTMRALREQGLPYRAIASSLDSAGIATRSGHPWASSSVAKILGDLPCPTP
jgi:site-specific DNA recombinase